MTVLRRFVILYFTLSAFPFPLGALSGLSQMPAPFSWIGDATSFAARPYQDAWNAAAVWVGDRLLGPGSVIIQPTGSGDTMAAYVSMLIQLVLTVIGTLAWTVAARGAPVSPRVLAAFRVYMRYYLAAVLLSYGFAKIPPTQFQPPGPELLSRTYGDSSPMGLLWTFMGYSPAYTMFAGLMELVPGVLLLFRRTALLGALLGVATMANIVALNFAYDVPVKLFSVHLLLALLIILAPDVPQLLNVFILNRDTPPAVLRPAHPHPRQRLILATKAVFIVLLLASGIGQGYFTWTNFGPGLPPAPLAGVYEVESFAVNGEERPPLWTDETRWRRFMISRRGAFVTLQRMADKSERFQLKHDEKAGTMVLTPPGSKESFTLTCRPDEHHLILEGPFRGSQLQVKLKKVADARFPLNTRGFNWVQELPYNR